MHHIWQFTHPDTWTPLATYPFAWPPYHSDIEALQAAGYIGEATLGIPDVVGGGMIWTLRDGERPYAFIVTLSLPGDETATIMMADAPDVLAYLAKYGGISLAAMLNQWSEGIERRLQNDW